MCPSRESIAAIYELVSAPSILTLVAPSREASIELLLEQTRILNDSGFAAGEHLLRIHIGLLKDALAGVTTMGPCPVMLTSMSSTSLK